MTTIARRWWIVALSVTIGLGVGFVVSQLIEPEYTASTRLFVSSTGGTSSTESYQGDQFSQQRTASYAHLINSEQVSQRVIDAMGLPMTADELAGHVTASIVPRTVLLDVAVTNSDPRRAADIANTLADQFIAFTGPLETPVGQSEPRSTVTIVSAAEPPPSPSYPKLSTNVLYGGAGGLVTGLVIVLLAAALSRHVRDTDDLETIVGSSGFGPVLLVKRSGQQRDEQLALWRGAEAEGFRRLRVQIEAHDPTPQVLLVTSVTRGDAGARFAADLSIAFSEAGRSTVLVGSDNEFGALVREFGVRDNLPGLAEWLDDRAKIANVVHPTPNPRLWLVPPGDTAYLEPKLSSPMVSQLLNDLRNNFDVIVLVTAGVNESSGASVLSAESDADLLVVDQSTARRGDLRRAADELRSVRANVLGSVLVTSK